MASLCFRVVAGVQTLWRGPSLKSHAWRALPGAFEYLFWAITYGEWDITSVPFSEGRLLPPIPQTSEEKSFAWRYLSEGLRRGVHEELTEEYVALRVRRGLMISSAIVAWAGEVKDRNGRFSINFHLHINHWPMGAVKLGTVPSFAVDT